MSLYTFHLRQIISTVLRQVDHGDQHGKAAWTRIWDETSKPTTPNSPFGYSEVLGIMGGHWEVWTSNH